MTLTKCTNCGVEFSTDMKSLYYRKPLCEYCMSIRDADRKQEEYIATVNRVQELDFTDLDSNHII